MHVAISTRNFLIFVSYEKFLLQKRISISKAMVSSANGWGNWNICTYSNENVYKYQNDCHSCRQKIIFFCMLHSDGHSKYSPSSARSSESRNYTFQLIWYITSPRQLFCTATSRPEGEKILFSKNDFPFSEIEAEIVLHSNGKLLFVGPSCYLLCVAWCSTMKRPAITYRHNFRAYRKFNILLVGSEIFCCSFWIFLKLLL